MGRGALLGPTFVSVLRAARRGRQSAWDAIYRDLAPPLLGYARSQNAPDPEDLVGEVFLEVVRSLSRFEGDEEERFRGWVFTIARRRLVDARRRSGRRPADLTAPGVLAERAGTYEDDALERLSLEDVRALLACLSEDQREVMVLRLVAGLRTAEIAEVTGRHPEAVKGLAKRAIARLREVLGTPGRSADDPPGDEDVPPPSGPGRR
ncbi:MAG: sigma-70 family RNA polymerase sigma factor [Actinobacteria bacterium]|jgi:RNA polymerase sigma-70 factor (ECF subfamily)|nr:sigma-70 family RNA polymerase sigma factor [Actinomycetota bacterium]